MDLSYPMTSSCLNQSYESLTPPAEDTGELQDSRYEDNTTDNGRGIPLSSHREKSQVARAVSCGDVMSILRWWLPELLASLISVISWISIIIRLKMFNSHGLQDINLPFSLTLNGLIALLSTVNRVTLMVPIASAISQDTWLWFYSASKNPTCPAQLRDLELSDMASRGACGSFLFLLLLRRR